MKRFITLLTLVCVFILGLVGCAQAQDTAPRPQWDLTSAYNFKSKDWAQITLAPPVLQYDDVFGVSWLDIDVRPTVGLTDGNGLVGGVIMHRTGIDVLRNQRLFLNAGLYGWVVAGRPTAAGIVVSFQAKL